jgi:hypothetical protein
MALSDGHYSEPVVSIGRGQGGAFARRNPADLAFEQIDSFEGDAAPVRVGVARGLRDILIVDPDPQALLAAQVAVQSVANVEACSDFRVARARLVARPPDLLVTNLRLERFNGLHLVYVAAGTATRCIVYTSHHDAVLAREVLAAGAFYERTDRLPQVLASYARATLPSGDRRSLSVFDRRSLARGGRRSSDV